MAVSVQGFCVVIVVVVGFFLFIVNHKCRLVTCQQGSLELVFSNQYKVLYRLCEGLFTMGKINFSVLSSGKTLHWHHCF